MFELWQHEDGELHLLSPNEPSEFGPGWQKIAESQDREVLEKLADEKMANRK